ncbi:MAG TPA: AAC(3) family N-acetyltransferase [Vicinamibacterales bacterium]|nr:AAC(3) family N-acetyltransferase [Vicinamibacterales bacterium]
MKQKIKTLIGDAGLARIRIVRQAASDLRSSFRPPSAPGYPIGISEIRTVLEESGIKRGDLLHVHTSVSHLMRASATPPKEAVSGMRTYSKALLEMLRDLVGPSGTLTMGTDFDRPAGWLKRLMAGVPLPEDVFDPRKSSSNRGLVSEYFRKLPDAVRSVHPYYNVTACGPLAEELVGEHHLSTPYVQDRHSPWFKLTERGGKVAMLGRTFEVNSLVHLVEYLHPAEYPRPLFMSGPVRMPYLDRSGAEKSIEVTLHSAGVPGSLHFDPRALHAFGSYINQRHGEVYKIKTLAFDAGIVCYDAKVQYNAFLQEMRNNVTWYDPQFLA